MGVFQDTLQEKGAVLSLMSEGAMNHLSGESVSFPDNDEAYDLLFKVSPASQPCQLAS